MFRNLLGMFKGIKFIDTYVVSSVFDLISAYLLEKF